MNLIRSLFKEENYIYLDDNKIEVKALNKFQRIFNTNLCDDNRQEMYFNRLCSLTLNPRSIPVEQRQEIQNFLKNYHYNYGLSQPISIHTETRIFDGKPIVVSQGIRYPSLEHEDYVDVDHSTVLAFKDVEALTRDINFWWIFGDKKIKIEISLQRVNDNTFVFSNFSNFVSRVNELDETSTYIDWCFNQIRAIARTIASDLREKSPNIYYRDVCSLPEAIQKKWKVEFIKEIFSDSRLNGANFLYQLIHLDSAEKIYDFSLGFNLGFDSNYMIASKSSRSNIPHIQ